MISLEQMQKIMLEGGRDGCVQEGVESLGIDYEDFLTLCQMYSSSTQQALEGIEKAGVDPEHIPAEMLVGFGLGIGFGMGTLMGIKLAQIKDLEETIEGVETDGS